MFRRASDPTGPQVTLVIDGDPVDADASETVAGVLLRIAPHVARRSVAGRLRAPYCLAGACFDCVALVDGRPVQTCLTAVRDGMDVRRQLAPPDLAATVASRPSSDPGTTTSSTVDAAESGS